jgi:UDP-2,4-diacetamido-2,4,6-trideoxy-beta-L-altropyranose hydrolase
MANGVCVVKADVRPCIAIRADGHHAFGLGHMYRMLSVAQALRTRGKVNVVFLCLAMVRQTGFDKVLNAHGFVLHIISRDDPYAEHRPTTSAVLKRCGASVVFTDLLSPAPADGDLLKHADLQLPDIPEYVAWLRSRGYSVASFSDNPDRVEPEADVVFNHAFHYQAPKAPQPWTKCCAGTQYFPLAEDMAALIHRARTFPDSARRILMMFGGSDHNNYTLRAVRAATAAGGLHVQAIVGAAMAERDTIMITLRGLGAEVYDAPSSVAALMHEADLVVTTGGNTVYELAALGTPMILMPVRERQERNAAYFAGEGAALNLGLGDGVLMETLKGHIEVLCKDSAARQRMSERGRATVDGRGAQRICQAVLELADQRHEVPA